jgi:hypothetical protein
MHQQYEIRMLGPHVVGGFEPHLSRSGPVESIGNLGEAGSDVVSAHVQETIETPATPVHSDVVGSQHLPYSSK